MDAYEDLKKGEKGTWISIIAYIGLSFLKLIIGYISDSDALLADGLNNTTDVIASAAVLIGLKISRKPPDRDHPYGHFRAETVASLVAALIMMAVGLQVLYQSFQKLFRSDMETPGSIAAWTALFCALVMYLVYRYNFSLAKKINSQAVMAAAQDNRSDALVSAGAFIGIWGSQWGWPWLDAVTAVAVGALICKTAWGIFRDSSHTLTDGFDQGKLGEFKRTISAIPGVETVKDIRARIHGNQVLVEVTIQVDHELNVVESHDITENIENQMLTEHKIHYVHVHIEPVETEAYIS